MVSVKQKNLVNTVRLTGRFIGEFNVRLGFISTVALFLASIGQTATAQTVFDQFGDGYSANGWGTTSDGRSWNAIEDASNSFTQGEFGIIKLDDEFVIPTNVISTGVPGKREVIFPFSINSRPAIGHLALNALINHNGDQDHNAASLYAGIEIEDGQSRLVIGEMVGGSYQALHNVALGMNVEPLKKHYLKVVLSDDGVPQIFAKVWPIDFPEPTSWMISGPVNVDDGVLNSHDGVSASLSAAPTTNIFVHFDAFQSIVADSDSGSPESIKYKTIREYEMLVDGPSQEDVRTILISDFQDKIEYLVTRSECRVYGIGANIQSRIYFYDVDDTLIYSVTGCNVAGIRPNSELRMATVENRSFEIPKGAHKIELKVASNQYGMFWAQSYQSGGIFTVDLLAYDNES